MSIITHKVCPCCGAEAIHRQLTAEDFTVSHQHFEIWECSSCKLRFTQDVPDAASIGDFYQSDAYISHTDTKEGIINRLYHSIRKTTLRQKRQLIRTQTGLQAGNILDIGAGTGAFANTMQQAGWNVTALEPDAATRQRSMALYNLSLQPGEVLFQLPEASFDAITMWHVLEHVHDIHAYTAQLKKLLKPKGKLFIAVPNYISYDASVYDQYWAAYDVPRHLYHFSPTAMQRLLQQHGLQTLDTKPMWFDSFYVSMLSEQYKKGHNNLFSATWTGFISNLKTVFNKQCCSSLIYLVGSS
jgi:SAM-dependent methyltransferase